MTGGMRYPEEGNFDTITRRRLICLQMCCVPLAPLPGGIVLLSPGEKIMPFSSHPKVTLIVDLQFGSTGKGLVAGFMSQRHNYDTVVSANMPNAGHTAYDVYNMMFVHKVLPSGIFSSGIRNVMIGPGAVFDPERLHQEVDRAEKWIGGKGATVYVHRASTPLTPEMKNAEQTSTVTRIASTAQGSMMAQFAKMGRDPENPVISGFSYTPPESLPIKVVSNREWLGIMYASHNILAEGSQGYSLGISQDFWPYVTSRDCLPARMMSDMAIPLPFLSNDDIIGVARTYPIRVGNTDMGNSGGHYEDQVETTWQAIGQQAEITTVTGRVRRLFTFSNQQFEEALMACCPGEVFMNFMNYVPIPKRAAFTKKVSIMCRKHGAVLKYLGYGPLSENVDMVDEKTNWDSAV
jgi:adenylosuccinate synthase